MIKLMLNVSAKEYANLLRLRELLRRANVGVTHDEVEEYRKVYDRVQSGVMLSAMMATESHNEEGHAHLREVAYG